MRTILRSLPEALLVLLFVYAAASKLADFEQFRAQLARQPFPPGADRILAVLLPFAELTAAGLLLFPGTRLTGLQASLALLILFTGYTGLVLLHWWSQVPCSCGGILGRLSWTPHFIFNCCFLCLNLTAIYLYFKERRYGS